MKSLSTRVDNLEDTLMKHLEESGVIQTDLLWLKRAFWTLVAGVLGIFLEHLRN